MPEQSYWADAGQFIEGVAKEALPEDPLMDVLDVADPNNRFGAQIAEGTEQIFTGGDYGDSGASDDGAGEVDGAPADAS